MSCRKGSLELALCSKCGLVFNRRYKANALDYKDNYDNSLDYSPTFRSYAQQLAERLTARYELRGKRIVGIGSGRGEFLRLLWREGANCTGYDPSYEHAAEEELPGLRFVKAYYGEAYASEPVDFVSCRHVLEHFESPLELLGSLRNILERNRNSAIYLEVPNGESVFAGSGLWDVIYPHVLYFTSDSLKSLLLNAEFEIIDSGTAFFGQYLFVEARVAPDKNSRMRSGSRSEAIDSRRMQRIVDHFAKNYRETVANWSNFLREAELRGERVVFWGAGAKGVTFLNVVPGAERIGDVVDLNVRKQGMYVPGTGQCIAAPISLKLSRPTRVICLNPGYSSEIASMLRSMGVESEIVTDARYRAMLATR